MAQRQELTSVLYPPPETVVEELNQKLSRWTLPCAPGQHRPIWPDPAEISAFLDAVDVLLRTILSWDAILARDADQSPYLSRSLDRAHSLLQAAAFRLSDEFLLLASGEELENPSEDGDGEDDGDNDEIPVAEPISDFNISIEIFRPAVVSDLHEIARRMVPAGFGNDICDIYSRIRRAFLDESAARIGFGDDRVEGGEGDGDLQREIVRWIQAMKLVVRVLFPSERRVADRIFSAFPSAAGYCFMYVSRALMRRLLHFADGVSVNGRKVELLFDVLQMYETLTDLLPHLDELFSGNPASASLVAEATEIRRQLRDSIRAIFREFEVGIQRDRSKPPAGGRPHALTRYVMNYMTFAADYRSTLDQIFASGQSSFEDQTVWTMQLLVSNLENKSKVYELPALRYLFLMNNCRYIASKVRDSEGLASALGADWMKKQEMKVGENALGYRRSAWGNALKILDFPDTQAGDPSLVPAVVVKEKMKEFNGLFEQILTEQSEWTVADEKLRTEVRRAVSDMLFPAYQGFLLRFRRQLARKDAKGEVSVRYTPEELQAQIDDLFERPVAGQRWRACVRIRGSNKRYTGKSKPSLGSWKRRPLYLKTALRVAMQDLMIAVMTPHLILVTQSRDVAETLDLAEAKQTLAEGGVKQHPHCIPSYLFLRLTILVKPPYIPW